MLEVRLLGSFQIKRGKKTVEMASRAAQSLFAYLILNSGTAYRREKLAGQLWPDSTEESARDYLRHALWRIRKALQGASSAAYLRADDLTISFDASQDYWLDVAALRSLGDQASADDLAAVLDAYKGELLPGFYDEWVVFERDHLQAVYEQKIGHLLDLLQDEGRWTDVLAWSEKWIALGQRPEAAFRYLISAHAGQGDLAKAAAAYERCRKSLAEFGLEPSEQTRSLFQSLRINKTTVPVSSPAKTGSSETQAVSARSGIPTPLTSFIERKQELDEIAGLLSKSRLLTLTGSGGVGKTRLAIESARAAIRNFKDGAFWVDLVGLADGSLIPQQIAGVVDVHESGQEQVIVTLQRALHSKTLLLILDNCEHVIDASAECAELLLAGCPNLKILATSRERLGLFHETVWRVPSLSERTSVQLFAERARAAQLGFAVNDSNRTVIDQICRRLDRIPLAIELAAARVRVLSPAEIAARLDDRFGLLTSGSRTALSRQQTLRGMIDWSHELLTLPERVLFRQLALFGGGFTLEAAEEICSGEQLDRGAVFTLLERLLDKSLVTPESNSNAGPTRYRLLETIRQYALEKLEASSSIASVRARHLEYYMRLAEEAESHLDGPLQADWIDRMEAEIDNIRIALVPAARDPANTDARLQSRHLEMRLRLAGALFQLWDRNHYQEGFQQIGKLLAESSEPSYGRAKALIAMGFLHWSSPDPTAARAPLEEALRLARDLRDDYLIGGANRFLGPVATAMGEYEAARLSLEECIAIGRRHDDKFPALVSVGLAMLADIPLAQGDYHAAHQLYEEAAVVARESKDINSLTYCSRRLGYLALKQNDFSKAAECFAESLDWNQQIRHQVGINRCVAAFACLRAAQGRLVEATQLSGAVEGFLNATSATLFQWDADVFHSYFSRLQAELPRASFDDARRKGLRMTLDEAVELALKGN